MTFYTPKTDDQLQEEALFAEGEYDFKVLEADDKKPSKAGNAMLTVKLDIMSDTGSQHIYDYIVPSTNFGERKLKAFAKALNLENEYTNGTLTADLTVGKYGKVKIGKQAATAEYPAKNIVAGLGYIESAEGPFDAAS